MNTKTVKHALNAYWYATQHLCNLAERYNRLKSQAEKITTTYSPAPGGSGNQDKISKAAANLADLEKEYQAEYQKARDAMHRVEALIGSLDDFKQRLILEDEYLDFKSRRQIAYNRHFSYRTVTRIHEQALIELNKHVF